LINQFGTRVIDAMKALPWFSPISIVLAWLPLVHADITLPAIISDHMVLEKTGQVPIWGKADPGESVTITLGTQTLTTTADADGNWKTALNLGDSGPGPFEMTISGNNKLVIKDVVVGEVWLASGQSNMEWSLNKTADADAEIAVSANPLLREFQVKRTTSSSPASDVQGAWVIASTETSGQFSAVAYYFAKRIQNELRVPVGVIHSAFGGTPSEAWTSKEALGTAPDLKEASERIWKSVADYPQLRASFNADFEAWLKKHKRADVQQPDAATYAGIDVSTQDWIPIQIPGAVRGKGFPDGGTVWLRKELTFPDKPDSVPLILPIDGYASVYWNGTLLAATDYETGHPNFVRRGGPYTVPASEVKAGTNVLAIRLYQPVSPANILAGATAAGQPLSGEWLAKTEIEFEPLDAATLAAAPSPPADVPRPQSIPSFLFNGMIHPLIPYAISGVIWYQGESNSSRAYQYRVAFPLLISDWRKKWANESLPFYFCQLANFKEKTSKPDESNWAELRDAQSATLSLPNTGQAVLIDIGEAGDIHPINKKDAGERLATIALAQDYGKDIVYSGPVYESMASKDGKVTLSFRHTDGGLVAKPLGETHDVNRTKRVTAPLVRNSPTSELEGFAICGEDKNWVWADAIIDGNTVVVSSKEVANPIAVRYAWSDNPTCNLYNGEALPASPFRTDDFPVSTADKKL